MMSADASAQPAPLEPFALEEVVFEKFVAKVTENKARRILRERKDTKDDLMLREVQATFDAPAAAPGTFHILLDLVSTSGPGPQLPLIDKVLPAVAKEAGQLFKSYRFENISLIQVVEKNTGQMISIPAGKR